MFRVITLNLNGIRSAAKKGFFSWLLDQNADVVCLQETKAQEKDLTDAQFCPQDFHCYYKDAEKKGYSGVGIYTKKKPTKVITTLGWDVADKEGRYIQVDLENVSIISLYLPSGSSGEERQQVKFQFLKQWALILEKIKASQRSYIICGDWNIVHKEIDIKNFRSNQKTSGCLPEERAWLDGVLTRYKFVDAFRVINQEKEQYTWWSTRGRAWDKNVGWRIDYQIISPDLAPYVRKVNIYKDARFSDHAPVIIDYDLTLG